MVLFVDFVEMTMLKLGSLELEINFTDYNKFDFFFSTVVHLYSNVEQGKEIHKFISTAGITVEISVKKNNLNRKKLYQQLDECGKNK